MMRSTKFVVIPALAMLLAAMSTTASAQSAPAASTEVQGFAGIVSDGGGPTFGGGVHFPVGPRLTIGVDAGYLLGSNDASGFGVDLDFSAIAVDAVGRYRFPLAGNDKLVPYALGGLGFLRSSASVSTIAGGISVSDTAVGVTLGGGVRWHAGDRWGVQPELKIFVADGSHVRATAALFYQFGS
jgi:opacity protein-like surface antigen